MKTIALTLFAAALGLAQSNSSATTTPSKDSAKASSTAQSKKPAQPSKASQNQKPPEQKAKAEPPLQSIPAGAKEVEPNLYRYTDSNGKTWNYRQTPFGISKSEETSVPASQAEPQPASQPNQATGEPVKVTDLGDSYRFEKQTPIRPFQLGSQKVGVDRRGESSYAWTADTQCRRQTRGESISGSSPFNFAALVLHSGFCRIVARSGPGAGAAASSSASQWARFSRSDAAALSTGNRSTPAAASGSGANSPHPARAHHSSYGLWRIVAQ